jgi:hypothetical protein
MTGHVSHLRNVYIILVPYNLGKLPPDRQRGERQDNIKTDLIQISLCEKDGSDLSSCLVVGRSDLETLGLIFRESNSKSA